MNYLRYSLNLFQSNFSFKDRELERLCNIYCFKIITKPAQNNRNTKLKFAMINFTEIDNNGRDQKDFAVNNRWN